MTITAERALTPTGWLDDVCIGVHDGVIADISPLAGRRADHRIVAPGFVDIQVNGFDDIDVGTADGDDWDTIAHALAHTGTTAWLPTLTTRPLDDYQPAFARIDTARRRRIVGAQIAGIHLEGPFLGRRHGAHRSRSVVPPDIEFCRALSPLVRLVTLGAETEGAIEVTRELAGRGIVVAIGHSEPSAEEVDDIVDAGARLVTHVFNAMSGVHHRDDGLALRALTDDRLLVSLIADGVHVSPRAMSLVWRARRDGVVLVTDAIAWRRADLRIDGAPRLADGTIAGSTLRMDQAIRNCVALGVPLADVLMAAATRPCRLLGLDDRGEIVVGRRADLVALDAELHPTTTWVGGEPVPGR